MSQWWKDYSPGDRVLVVLDGQFTARRIRKHIQVVGRWYAAKVVGWNGGGLDVTLLNPRMEGETVSVTSPIQIQVAP